MKRLVIIAAAAAVAAAPASMGLLGNASFAESAPVRVPAQAAVSDDHGRHVEPGDDRRAQSPRPVVTVVSTRPDAHARHVEPGDDRGEHAEPGDDRGQHAEPGDDRGHHAEPGDDRGGDERGRHGRDDGAAHR